MSPLIRLVCHVVLLCAFVESVPLLSSSTKRVADPSVYPAIVRYAEYAAASMANTCKVPPFSSKALEYINVPSTDTQATLFRDDAAKELILSYRGSSTVQDMVNDLTIPLVTYNPPFGLKCQGCKVNLGWYKAWKSVAAQSEAALDKALSENPTYKIVIVGHSLGGALVKFAFVSFKHLEKYTVASAYSYGEPRIGNAAFADFSDAQAGATDTDIGIYYRVTHANDGIPRYPYEVLEYRQSRTEFWEQNASNGKPSPGTLFRCFGQEPTDCVNSQGGIGPTPAHTSYAGMNCSAVCGTGVPNC